MNKAEQRERMREIEQIILTDHGGNWHSLNARELQTEWYTLLRSVYSDFFEHIASFYAPIMHDITDNIMFGGVQL